MAVELKVPEVGESIAQVQIAHWLAAPGQKVARDQNLVVIESDKATFEVPAPMDCILAQVLKGDAEMARVGEVIAVLEEVPAAAEQPDVAKARTLESVGAARTSTAGPLAGGPTSDTSAPPAGGAGSDTATQPAEVAPSAAPSESASPVLPEQSPSAALSIPNVSPTSATAAVTMAPSGTGKTAPPAPAAPVVLSPSARRALARQRHDAEPAETPPAPAPAAPRQDEAVPMSMLRRRVAERLVRAQHEAALLTTFNEIDMTAVMELRLEHREAFERRYGVKLGFTAFFVRAAVDALRTTPEVNATIHGDDLIYHNYCDIGIAVGGGRGLVVPVLRNAESLSFAEIEASVADFGERARDNRILLEELSGGTFTISNGGIYGSLLSTPIVNPPQSAILGLHAIQERPVARQGQVVIRPMMYVALTYDHRVIDGREAVTFLRRIRECLEAPSRMLLEI